MCWRSESLTEFMKITLCSCKTYDVRTYIFAIGIALMLALAGNSEQAVAQDVDSAAEGEITSERISELTAQLNEEEQKILVRLVEMLTAEKAKTIVDPGESGSFLEAIRSGWQSYRV